MKMITDIVLGNNFGDEAKGKVVHHLLREGKYSHCIRGSGGPNCGHTIFHNGKKFVTHAIPAGVFFGVKSIIGPGCVLNVKSFLKELSYLEDNGIDCRSLVKVAGNVHIITDEHIAEDSLDTKIGTTKKGVGQAYRDKYARTGIRAESVTELKEYLCDFYEEIFSGCVELCYEGAQGFHLDIDHGTYPYVTSSHTTVAGALLNGIPHTSIRDVYGVGKAYDTYVGAMEFQPKDNEELIRIQHVGNEVGATTGRVRQCNYLNVDMLQKVVNINAVSKLVINKMDILQKVNCYKVIEDNKVMDLKNEKDFIFFLNRIKFPELEIKFSYSPEKI